jgi:hypothetical protein
MVRCKLKPRPPIGNRRCREVVTELQDLRYSDLITELKVFAKSEAKNELQPDEYTTTLSELKKISHIFNKVIEDMEKKA